MGWKGWKICSFGLHLGRGGLVYSGTLGFEEK
jgi:hypothetical protein